MSNGFERKSTSGEMMMLNGTVVNHGPVAGGLGKQSFLSDPGWWPRSGHGRTPTWPKRYGRERLWRETARYSWVQERLFPGFTEDSAERASLSASQAGLGCKRTTRILPYCQCLWRNADSSKAEKSRVVRHKAEHSVSYVNTSELGESNLSCGIRPQQIQQ